MKKRHTAQNIVTLPTPNPRGPRPHQPPPRTMPAGANAFAAGPPAPLRLAQNIALAVIAVLGVIILMRLGFVFWISTKASDEIESASQMLGLTAELTWLMKTMGILLVIDLIVPVLITIGLASVGKPVRWNLKLAQRLALLLVFFSIKPAISALTGRHVHDAMVKHVREIDPSHTELFDSRTREPLAGVVEELDGSVKFYPLTKGYRPSDGRPIRAVTSEDVLRWQHGNRAAAATR